MVLENINKINDNMKNIKIIVIITLSILFYSQNITAQSRFNETQNKAFKKENYKKIAKTDIPEKVKKYVGKIAGYKIKNTAVSLEKNKNNKGKLYLVTLVKGVRTMRLLVNEEGKEVYMFE